MNHTLMITLLIDFYIQARLEDPTAVEAWCRAKGITKADLDAVIDRWQVIHNP